MPVMLKAKGLKTYDNELANTDGYMEQADNVVIDEPHVVEKRRGNKDHGDLLPTDNDRLKQLLQYKDRLIRHYNSVLQYDNGSGTFTDFNESITEPLTDLRLRGQESNGNFYFTSDKGIKKISVSNAADINANSIEKAGAPKGLDVEGDLVYTDGGFLPPQSKVAYRIVWGKTDANGNLLLGSPSSRLVISNTTQDVNLPEIISIQTVSQAATPDLSYFLLSDSQNDYYVWMNKSGTTEAPVGNDTLGRTPIECDIQSATTDADVATRVANSIASLGTFDISFPALNTLSITSIEDGENLVDAVDGITATTFIINVDQQGEIVTGTNANVNLTFTVPQDVDSTDYFYQIYRSGVVTVPAGLSLDDIDPGDDLNLIIEEFVTDPIPDEITVLDLTPESFRESGAFLYTNANTGSGILSANELPPIATDIELFRNYMFYANTKTFHRKELRILSVVNFVSNSSGILIGNSTQEREYTYVGETQVETIQTVADVANSLDGTYFDISSSRDETMYRVWFSTGIASTPTVTNEVLVKVSITTGDSAIDVATAMSTALSLTGDFSADSAGTNTSTVTWGKNGTTSGTTDVSTGFTFNISTAGEGEDAPTNQVLLSNLASPGQAIDETARSLVKVINKDTNSPVIARYLSGPDDLPGIILFEAKELTDDTFYIGSLDNTGSNYEPVLEEALTISSISAASSTEITTTASHNYVTGDKVYIFDTNSTPAIQGEYTISVTGATTFTIPAEVTVAGNFGGVVKATVTSDNEESPNRVYFSKLNQPDAVPIANYIDIGPRDKKIQRILALRDNLFVLKEDGVYIITGTSSPFTSRSIDNSVVVIAPDTAVVLNNQIYALTSQGVARIDETGAGIISSDIEDKILGITNSRFDFQLTSFGVAYESDRAYIVWLPTETDDTTATQAYRYSYYTDAWTRWTVPAKCGEIFEGDDKLYLGLADRNVMTQERKNETRKDYADKDFQLTIPSDSVNEYEVKVSTVSDLVVGDVLTQVQYVTLSIYNRLLRKLDIDSGMDNDYNSTLVLVAGDNITNKMQDLNDKLVLDDSSGTITAKVMSTDWSVLQGQFNDIINELNDVACDSQEKDYKTISGTYEYEGIILIREEATNTLTLHAPLPLFEGSVTMFKNIEMEIEYAPQHFGDPSLTKQVRDGTIMFDQNNFHSAKIGFSSDLSQDFSFYDFNARESGDYGTGVYGENNYGGNGSEVPERFITPRNKQRCRFLKVKFIHINARERIRINGITLNPRAMSQRGYR